MHTFTVLFVWCVVKPGVGGGAAQPRQVLCACPSRAGRPADSQHGAAEDLQRQSARHQQHHHLPAQPRRGLRRPVLHGHGQWRVQPHLVRVGMPYPGGDTGPVLLNSSLKNYHKQLISLE